MGKKSGKMENMDLSHLFSGVYQDKRVLITGHTGFKGSWLSFWLKKMGAHVVGYALEPNTNPSHFQLLDLKIDSIISDINNLDKLKQTINSFKPEIIFHLAAQPLVRLSYESPLETLSTNIIGTANLLEACRNSDTVKAIVIITSDKCYENNEWLWGYRETDPMGGFDPYSVSKGSAELVVSSYRRSFFNLKDFNKKHTTLIASARAGNVIGGGDWSVDRLIPDIVKATTNHKKTLIRNPNSTRPWQHVLDPLSAYLLLGQKLIEGNPEFADSFNFGPGEQGENNVSEILEISKEYWSDIDFEVDMNSDHPHEANYLKLDCSKAIHKLSWNGVWDVNQAINSTISWYKAFYLNQDILTEKDLYRYINDAENKKLIWTKNEIQ